MDEDVRPLGLVPLQGRGSLPYALLHGESLIACATWLLDEAGVEVFDFNVPWELVAGAGRPLVVHDPLTPAVPVEFVRALADDVRDEVLVGVRPLTDTLKEIHDGRVGGTLDRDAMVAVVGPVVLPAAVVATLAAPPEELLEDLVTRLALSHPVDVREAPAGAMRITTEADLALL